MGKNIGCDFNYTGISFEELTAYQEKINDLHSMLHSKVLSYTGWVDYPMQIEASLLAEIEGLAEHIRSHCTAFVLVGVGGSYLGARAGIELFQHSFHHEMVAHGALAPKVYFAGHNLNSQYLLELFQVLANQEVIICVVSKSGSTLDTAISFDLLKRFLEEKYGSSAKEHIYVITDERRGVLRKEATERDYKTLAIPEDIGGRYSVLTPVGLLPLAVAGVDIRQVIAGARKAWTDYASPVLEENDCYCYALSRYLLNKEQKKVIEIFETYHPKLYYFTEWLKQLYGESEGKNKQGIFPATMQMSTDLHSLGQFLQDGTPCFFETVLTIAQAEEDLPIILGEKDEIQMTLNKLNEIVQKSVLTAHQENQTPNIKITMPALSAEAFGGMIYFFEKSCAMSGLLQEVNPFDQPGVERYKAQIKRIMY